MAKNTILMIGDGMGWEMARAAAIQKQINAGKTGDTLADFYTQGVGTGLNFQRLAGYGLATTYGTTVADAKGVFNTAQSALDGTVTATGASPLLPGFQFDPTFNPGTTATGGAKVADGAKGNLVGYDPARGGVNPWTAGSDKEYIKFSYPDSANTATTLYTGVKSYNNAIGVDISEQSLSGILKQAADKGKATGLVTSVPIDHATPGAAAANVNRRSKYDLAYPALDNILQQELRIYQPDVLLGGGHPLSTPGDPLPNGVEPKTSNEFIAKETYAELSGKPNSNLYGYTFLERGKDAAKTLADTAKSLDPTKGQKLLGLYGARGQNGNLPVSSANGDYSTTGLDMFQTYATKGLKPDLLRPLAPGETDAQFIAKERNENPTLQQLSTAALDVLGKDKDGFYLMIEGGDVDWAAHDNNLDNLIGATLDFDKSVGSVIDWIEKNGGWEQNELIVTADHDHYMTLNPDFPKLLRTIGAEKMTELDTAKEAGYYFGSKPDVVKLADGKDDPESGKYGWGNHSNRPVPVYYQGADTKLLASEIGKGFQSYGKDVPGIPGLIDQTTIYKAQAVGVNEASLKTYNFTDLPTVGTTAKVNPADPTKTVPGQEIKLGGYSGLRYEGLAANGNLKFIANTDRGPNVGANYPLPAFQPEIDRFELNKATGKITITERIKITRPDGKPLTGIPNLQGGAQNGLSGLAYTDDPALDLFGNKIKNDPLGGDFEGIEVAKDGTFWMVDEYRPSIYHIDAKGKMIDRFIPKGAPTADGSFGKAVLPADYAQRRSNRGFEGVAIEGTKLYTFMQSALDIPDTADDAASKAGSNLRILEFDTVKKTVTGEYIYRLDNVKVADKIGDAVSLGNGKFAVVERDSLATDSSFKAIYEIDISKATNVYNPKAAAGSKSIEETLKTNPTAATPVTKKLIANATALGYTGVEKLEGLALVDKNTLALINDNDFNLGAAKADGKGALTGIAPVPTKLGLLTLDKPLFETKKPTQMTEPKRKGDRYDGGKGKDDLFDYRPGKDQNRSDGRDRDTMFADKGGDKLFGGMTTARNLNVADSKPMIDSRSLFGMGDMNDASKFNLNQPGGNTLVNTGSQDLAMLRGGQSPLNNGFKIG
jgi:alkaline phosphatase